jgi:hypothetical protein
MRIRNKELRRRRHRLEKAARVKAKADVRAPKPTTSRRKNA